MGTDTLGTMITVVGMSFVGAAFYVGFSGTSVWPTIVQVLTVSGAFYAFVIQRFE